MKSLFSAWALVLLSLTASVAQTVSSDPPKPKPSPEPVAAGRPSSVAVPPEKAEPVSVPKFAKAPIIDGKLDDDVWNTAARLKDFYQTTPGDNIAPSKPTEVFVGYDSKFLYFAFHAYDEPAKVRATMAGRDDVFNEDHVSVFLDTFNDQRKAYVLGFNPLGVQQDGILTEGGNTDFSVDIVMESKGQLTADGWIVEVAIPFKSLRYQAGGNKLWGFHVWRRIDRDNETDSWMPISRDIAGRLTQAAHLTGLDGISRERTLELIPSLTFSETGKRVNALSAADLAQNPALLDPGRMVNQPIKIEPGLTVKYGITPTVTLDLALNPDFAQVEADETVITANQRFPIFFEEKRPFFLEGIDIFQTRLQPVHTRAIVDPDIAMKVSGKLGRNTFGLMVASDNAPGNFTEDDRNDPFTRSIIDRFLDKNAYIGVLRLKRDIGKDSSIGLVATTYNFIEKHNHLLGIDGRFSLGPQTYFNFQVIGTNSRRCFFEPRTPRHAPSAGEPCFAGAGSAGPISTRNHYRSGNGLAYSYNYDFTGRHFGYRLSGEGRTRDYRADVGFTRRRNTNFHDLFVRYSSEPKPKATLISWRVFNSTRTNFDWQGHTQGWEDESQLQFNFQRSSHFGVGFVGGYERLFEEEFGPARTTFQQGTFFGPDPERSTYQATPYLFAGTQPHEKFGVEVSLLHTSGAFDLDFGGGERFPRISPAALAFGEDAPLDPGPGGQWNLELDFSFQPTDALSLELEYQRQRLRRRDTGLVAFEENVYSLKSTYQFTRFLFARARVDYETLESSLRGQFLLGWTPNPGTAFYAGYNDDLVRNGFSPFTGQLEPGLRRNGRTFFIKMSYLFRRSFGG